MTLDSTLVHDADDWQRRATVVARLRDEMTSIAEVVASHARALDPGEGAERESVDATLAALTSHAVTRLRFGAAELGHHCFQIARGSGRIVAADGGDPGTDAVNQTPRRVAMMTKSSAAQPGTDVCEQSPQVVAELAPGRWPTIDVDAFRRCAGRLRADAAALGGLAEQTVSSVVDGHAAGPRGRAFDAMTARTSALCAAGDGVVADAVRSVTVVAGALDAYADAAATTRDDMRTVAARVDVDRARAALLAAVGGETALVEPAAAGRLALASAADDYRVRVDEIGRRHTEQVGAGSPSAGGLGGVGSMVAGSAIVASSGQTTPRRPTSRGAASPPATPDAAAIRRRAGTLADQLPRHLDVRMAVGLATTRDRTPGGGDTVILLATSDDHDYLRPGVTLDAGEWFVGRGYDPTATLHDIAGELRVDLIAVASTARPE